MHAKALEEIHKQKIQTKDLKNDNTELLLKLSMLEKNQKDRSSEISCLEAENKEMKGNIEKAELKIIFYLQVQLIIV